MLCVVRCEGRIDRAEESPSVYECECDVETSKMRRPKAPQGLLSCCKVLAGLFNMVCEGVHRCLCAFVSA